MIKLIFKSCLFIIVISLTACFSSDDNSLPVADAGGDQTVASGSTVTLAGSGTDSDGSITTYAWSTTQSDIVFTDNPSATTTFEAPEVTTETDLSFTIRLTVTDDGNDSAFDDITITVTSGKLAAEKDSAWTIVTEAPVINNAIHTGTKYIAVGNKGYIAESTDGKSWTQFDLDTAINFQDIITNGTQSIALNDANEGNGFHGYAISTDGSTWKLMDDFNNSDCSSAKDITYDGNQFVGIFGYGKICTSSDGVTWTLKSDQMQNLYQISFGAGKYVFVNDTNSIITMDDITTTAINVPSLGTTGTISDIIYANSIFVVVQSGKVLYSANGNDWTLVAGTDSPDRLYRMSYSSEKGFVSEANVGFVYTSIDGMSWNKLDNSGLPVATSSSFIVNGSTESLLFDLGQLHNSTDLLTWSETTSSLLTGEMKVYLNHNSTIFAAQNTDGKIYRSTDNGVSWSVASGLNISELYSIIHDGTRYIASGRNGVSSSTDGINWTTAFTSESTRLNTLRASAQLGSTIYYFQNTARVLSTTDNINFQEVSNSGIEALTTFNQVVSNNSIIVAVASSSNIVNYDGTNWSIAVPNSGNTGLINDLIWTGTHFIVAGNSGKIMTSTDGETWTTQTPWNGAGNITDILAVGTDLYATDTSGSVASSADNGVTWTERKDYSGTGTVIGQLAHDGTSFFGYGQNSFGVFLATSTDGIIWSGSSALFDSTLPNYHINYDTDNNRFVANKVYGDDIFASSNGTTWDYSSLIPNDDSYSYIKANTKFFRLVYGPIIHTNGTNTYTSGSAVHSEDGINWTINTNQIYNTGYTPTNGIYVNVGNSFVNGATGKIETSTDGITYSIPTITGLNTSQTGDPEFIFVKYVNNQYIGLHQNDLANKPSVYTSTDGTNWIFQIETDLGFSKGNIRVKDIEYDGTNYLILSDHLDTTFGKSKGTMITKSTDLKTFTLLETGITATMTDLIIEDNGYVLIGEHGTIATHGLYQ